MIRNYIVDYNEKGVAKHQVFQAFSFGTPESDAYMMVEYIRQNGWVLVQVVEIMGSYTLDSLRELSDQPPAPDISSVTWYLDKAEAIKTLPQDIERLKEFL